MLAWCRTLVRSLRQRRRAERELDEELRFHVEMAIHYYQQHVRSFSGVFACTSFPMTVRIGDAAEQVQGELVTDHYFSVLGSLPPLAVCSFHATDDPARIRPSSRATNAGARGLGAIRVSSAGRSASGRLSPPSSGWHRVISAG